MSATLIKLASSHRLTPVDGFDEKTGFILRFTQADGVKPHALSRHTKDSHFVPRWGERSLSLAFAFSYFSILTFFLLRHPAATFRPLHSAALHFRRLQFRSTAFRRPQTGETVKKTSCAPAGFRRPRDFV